MRKFSFTILMLMLLAVPAHADNFKALLDEADALNAVRRVAAAPRRQPDGGGRLGDLADDPPGARRLNPAAFHTPVTWG